MSDRIRILNQYFNYGYTGRTDKFLSVLAAEFVLRKNAPAIERQIREQVATGNQTGMNSILVHPPLLSSPDQRINVITKHLKDNLAPFIRAAYVHGSVATGEVINYSDYDGLLILRSDIFDNRNDIVRAAREINRSYALMLNFDPLQHHGWMIVADDCLDNWPVNFFPPELFEFSRSLLDTEASIKIQYKYNPENCINSFRRNAGQILSALESNGFPADAFSLKSLLSEFMLLPSLYLTAKNSQGIFKKFSFHTARVDFDPVLWSVMDDVSMIRHNWPDYRKIFQESNNSKVNYLTRKNQIRKSALTRELKEMLHPDLVVRMKELVKSMMSKIQ